MVRSAKCLVALLVLLPLSQEVAADTPAPIPDYGGVVLHIPSADGDPTSYSREGHRLVLVLAADDRTRDGWRDIVGAKNLDGLVTVISAPSLDHIPLIDDLAGITVIENWSDAQRRGLRWREVLRVSAPFGHVAVKSISLEAVETALKGQRLSQLAAKLEDVEGWTLMMVALPSGMGEWTHSNIGTPGLSRVAPDLADLKAWSSAVYQIGVAGYSVHGDRFDVNRRSLWPRWISGVYLGNQYRGGAVAAGGLLYTGSGNEPMSYVREGSLTRGSFLVARNAFNGVIRWTRREGTVIAANRDVVLLKSRAGLLAASPKTGETIWEKSLRGFAVARLTDTALLFGDSNKAIRVEPMTGETVWEHELPHAVAEIAIQGDFAVLDSFAKQRDAAHADVGPIRLVDLATGKTRWEVEPAARKTDGGTLRLHSASQRYLILNGPDEFRVHDGDGGEVFQYRYPVHPVTRRTDRAVRNRVNLEIVDDLLLYTHATPIPERRKCEKTLRLRHLPTGEEREVTHEQLLGMGSWGCNGGGVITAGAAKNLAGLDTGLATPEQHELIGHLPIHGTCGIATPVAYHTAFQLPQNCVCLTSSNRLRGAVAAGAVNPPPKAAYLQAGPLEKGPAFTRAAARPKSKVTADSKQPWPTYLGNNLRSASVPHTLPGNLKLQWRRKLAAGQQPGPIAAYTWRCRYLYNGAITAPTVADGKVFVALPQRHRVLALDLATGEPLWRFTTDGPVDSPPTWHAGLCCFGCRDGYVYVLDADSGQLAWRRRIAPDSQRMNSFGQLENRFPAIGSVTIQDGLLHATAGLHGEVGIMLAVLAPGSGEVKEYRQLPKGAFRNDVLIANAQGQLHLGAMPIPIAAYEERLEALMARHAPLLRKRPDQNRVPTIGLQLRREGLQAMALTTDYPLGLDAELLSVARTTSLSAGIRRNKQRNPAVMTFVHNGVTAQHWAWNDTWQIGLRMTGAGEQRGPELAIHDVVAFRRQHLAQHLDEIRNGPRSRDLTQADPAWQRPIGRGWSIAIAGNTGLVAGPAPTGPEQDYLAAPGHLEGFSLEDGATRFKIPLDRTIVQDGLAVAGHGIVLTLADESVAYVGP